MIRTPSGKNLMNEHEAIQWLLDNNALPFQCTADYVGGAEIGLGTIVNPTPAKVRVGSLIFFADSKVSTVIAITSNSFICSDEYNDLVDDIVYVSNVQLNASGHLIVTLSNGSNIDAGLIKQISNFSINASQHLIANYNDGTSTDLGAIFQGNVNIAGNFTADSIIENMTGYGVSDISPLISDVYCNVVKNGRKITFVFAFDVTLTAQPDGYKIDLGKILVPNGILSQLYAYTLQGISNVVSQGIIWASEDLTTAPKRCNYFIQKSYNGLWFEIYTTELELNKKYLLRIEQTYTLGDNLAA